MQTKLFLGKKDDSRLLAIESYAWRAKLFAFKGFLASFLVIILFVFVGLSGFTERFPAAVDWVIGTVFIGVAYLPWLFLFTIFLSTAVHSGLSAQRLMKAKEKGVFVHFLQAFISLALLGLGVPYLLIVTNLQHH